jgi:hypothetical protein
MVRSVVGLLPITDILPSKNIVFMFVWAVEKFKEYSMMEDTKLYRGIAPCLQDLLIMGDGLPVLPNLIHHVLKRIIQVRCVVFGLFRHWGFDDFRLYQFQTKIDWHFDELTSSTRFPFRTPSP